MLDLEPHPLVSHPKCRSQGDFKRRMVRRGSLEPLYWYSSCTSGAMLPAPRLKNDGKTMETPNIPWFVKLCFSPMKMTTIKPSMLEQHVLGPDGDWSGHCGRLLSAKVGKQWQTWTGRETINKLLRKWGHVKMHSSGTLFLPSNRLAWAMDAFDNGFDPESKQYRIQSLLHMFHDLVDLYVFIRLWVPVYPKKAGEWMLIPGNLVYERFWPIPTYRFILIKEVVPNFIPKEHGSPTLIKGVRTNAESSLSCGSVWHTGRLDISISLW